MFTFAPKLIKMETTSPLNSIVLSDFETMKSMLDDIRDKMKTHINPLDKIEYIKPIKMMIFEAWWDMCENGKPTFTEL